MKYYFDAFKKYLVCDGRATRREYWWYVLINSIVTIVLLLLDSAISVYSDGIYCGYEMTVFYQIIMACPSICLQVRRLHDVGKTGYLWLIRILPFGWLGLLIWNLEPSEPIINAYGCPENGILLEGEEQPTVVNQVGFCRKCGGELANGSSFCNQCGTTVLVVETDVSEIQSFTVVVYDISAGKMRTETRDIDIKRFPPEKFTENNMYHAIESEFEGKRVLTYCKKDLWETYVN